MTDEALKQAHQIIEEGWNEEISMALAMEPKSMQTQEAKIVSIHEFENQQRTEGSVMVSGSERFAMAKRIEKEGAIMWGDSHDHIEANGHGRLQSDQDKKTNLLLKKEWQKQLHWVFYARKDGGMEVRLFNDNNDQVDVNWNGWTGMVMVYKENGQKEFLKEDSLAEAA